MKITSANFLPPLETKNVLGGKANAKSLCTMHSKPKMINVMN